MEEKKKQQQCKSAGQEHADILTRHSNLFCLKFRGRKKKKTHPSDAPCCKSIKVLKAYRDGKADWGGVKNKRSTSELFSLKTDVSVLIKTGVQQRGIRGETWGWIARHLDVGFYTP